MATQPDPFIELANDIAGFTHDPLGHARYAYSWGEGVLQDVAGPRAWQAEMLSTIGGHLSNPETRFQPCCIAIGSGHGIGKSAGIGMVTKWGLDTCEDSRIVMTANTESQILTKTVPEVTKWHNLSITSDWFKPTATAFISTVKGHEKSWRADAVTWSLNNTEAFAGLHNKGKRIIIIMDEASNIADKVWEVTEGALTDEETEIIWLAFGNPTRATGRFRECFGRYKHRWYRRLIDSRTVEGTNKAYLDEMVATYGENSDIVKVRVRGMFPSASSLQFIGTDVVQAARTRHVQTLPSDPLIFGLDVARFGDDHSTLAIRQGRDARKYPWKRWHKTDTMQIAGDVAVQADLLKPDAIFVDVGAMGAGVIDRLRQLVDPSIVFEVNFGGAGRDANWSGNMRIKTFNKRAEMWCNGRAWLAGGAIPDDQEVEDDLTGIEYSYSADQEIQLEKKEHMKARGLASPDDGDALMLTFAEHVAPREVDRYTSALSGGAVGEYDPYAELR